MALNSTRLNRSGEGTDVDVGGRRGKGGGVGPGGGQARLCENLDWLMPNEQPSGHRPNGDIDGGYCLLARDAKWGAHTVASDRVGWS